MAQADQMDRLGNQILSGAALPRHQDRRIPPGDHMGEFINALHRRRVSDHPANFPDSGSPSIPAGRDNCSGEMLLDGAFPPQ